MIQLHFSIQFHGVLFEFLRPLTITEEKNLSQQKSTRFIDIYHIPHSKT